MMVGVVIGHSWLRILSIIQLDSPNMLRSALPIFSTKSRNKFYGRRIFRFPSLQRNHPKVPTTTSPNQTNHTNTINPKSPSIPQKTSSHIPLSRKFTQLTKRTTIIPKFPGLNGCRTLDPQRKKALLKPHQIPDQGGCWWGKRVFIVFSCAASKG